MNSPRLAITSLAAAILGTCSGPALAQQPALDHPILDCGGGVSHGTGANGVRFGLRSSVGQHAAATDIQGLTGTSPAGVVFSLVGGASPGAPPPPPCAPDFNADGNLDPDDLSDYITCFFTQAAFPGACREADYNADGNIDPDDLSDYITAFFAGC